MNWAPGQGAAEEERRLVRRTRKGARRNTESPPQFHYFSPLSLFCGALDKNPFRLLKTDRNEADAYTDVRRMDRGERERPLRVFRGRFNSRRSNTTPGQIDFGSIVHSRITAKRPAILVVISQSLFISKNCTWSQKCHYTWGIWPQKWQTLNRFNSHCRFPGQMNLTVKMNLTDDY